MKSVNLNESNGRNGHKATLLEPEIIADSDTLEARIAETPIVTEETTEHPPVATPPTKKRKPIGLILAFLGAGALVASSFGYRYWEYASSHQDTDNATVAGHINQISSKVPGTVEQVLVTDNQEVKAGQLLVKLDPRDYENKVTQAKAALATAQQQAQAAQSNIDLSSQTTNAKTTQARGDINAALAGISTAQATVEEARAGIPAAEAEVNQTEAGIPAAQAQVAQADATLQKTQADYNRYQSLFQQGAIAQQQLDNNKAAYNVAVAQKNAAIQGVEQARALLTSAKVGVLQAKSKLAQAQEGIATAQAKLATSKGGLEQVNAGGQQTNINRGQYAAAKSSINQAEAALKDAQLQLSYINITAPAAGRVGKKNVEVGNRIQAGSPLMAIVNNDYWVIANFKETQLEAMKPGQLVEIKLDSFPHHNFKGKVDSLAPASGAVSALLPPDNATGNFTKIVQRIPVKVTFDPSSIKGYETRITPGMSAEVSIEIK
jgi:membrane fusion protein, multidrug efflux system